MKFIATLAAFAGAAAAAKPVLTGTGAVYTTVTETAYTTYCPAPTSFEFNHQTYTVTEATTLTITDCPDNACTYVKPIYTSTAVSCGSGDCYGGGYHNSTAPMPTATGTAPPSGCNGSSCSGDSEGEDEAPIEAGAGKVAVFSGAALAGVLALAAAL